MLKRHLSVATCNGNSSNCLYPNLVEVTDGGNFIQAISFDHVAGSFKGNYRSWNGNKNLNSFFKFVFQKFYRA